MKLQQFSHFGKIFEVQKPKNFNIDSQYVILEDYNKFDDENHELKWNKTSKNKKFWHFSKKFIDFSNDRFIICASLPDGFI